MTARETKGRASAPPAKRYITREWLNATLQKHCGRGHNGGIDLPPPSHWIVLAAKINNYIDAPWSNYNAGGVYHQASLAQQDRKTLDDAARILKRDLDRFPDTEGFADLRRRWAEAIVVLRYPRSAADNPQDQLSTPIDEGDWRAGWAYTAREIIPDLVVFAVHGRADVRASPGCGVIKTLLDILHLIYPPETLPTPRRFCTVVKNDIDKYVKIAKTNQKGDGLREV